MGGFNEFLIGYGFDDKDLRARVMAVRGGEGPPLQPLQLGVIRHSALERIGAGPAMTVSPFLEARAKAQKRASAMANRVLAASCPWTAQRRAVVTLGFNQQQLAGGCGVGAAGPDRGG